MTTTGTTGPPAAGAAAAGPTGSGPAAGPGGAAASAEPDGFGVPVEPGGLKPTVGSGGSRMAAGADWSPVTGVPPELLALAERCLQADGGMPLATDPGFLARRWAAPGVVAFALRGDDGALLAAGAARPAGDGAVFTGLVDPAARSRGLGARLLDQGLAAAADLSPAGHNATPRPIITVETESLTADADALFASRGLRQTFAEHVQRIDLITPRPPAPPRPPGATITTWSAATAHRFHTTYAAAFRDRPGFLDPPPAEWIADYQGDDDFRPECSLLMTLPGAGDAGFVTAARDWIVQVGVVPSARRRGLAAALLGEALSRLHADGSDHAFLTVNVNNPGAAALYRRLGFADCGLRARYQR